MPAGHEGAAANHREQGGVRLSVAEDLSGLDAAAQSARIESLFDALSGSRPGRKGVRPSCEVRATVRAAPETRAARITYC